MSTTFTLLSPVKENELRLTFGYTETISIVAEPEKVFAPAINHFKKLAIGTYFWFIADPINWLVHAAGGSLETMTPIKHKDFVGQSPEQLFKTCHPEDIVKMFAFSQYWITYFNGLPADMKPHVGVTIYLRLLNASHIYNWFMVQYADCIVDESGRIIYGLTLVTDISHIKKEGTAMMSILNTYDESCQQFLCADGQHLTHPELPPAKLSLREIEVLRLLARGFSSKQIAASLEIAIKTTDNHRQNMLRKTGTKSTGELVAYGVTMGYL
ncbi:MAG: helix-turn-helix transcriptional regulator [Bacteroidetes bacterium]|nr:helix-turn-helix transcriptional regulator [Bacteroidota bacterium]